MTIDTILFDLDGTLVQHSHVLLPQKLAEWGHPRPADEVERAFLRQIHWFYENAPRLVNSGQDNRTMWERLWRKMYRSVAIDLALPEGDEFVDKMQHFFAAEPTPPLFEDAPPLIERLAALDLRMGIITQRGRVATERFLRDHDLHGHFAVIVAGDDGHGRKPSTGPFRRALRVLKSHPERAIFVGDRVDDDCGGACAAGLRAFLIDRDGLHTEKADADDVDFTPIASLLDLLEHLALPTPREPNELWSK